MATLTKKQFCKCMKLIRAQRDKNEAVLAGLETAFGSRATEYMVEVFSIDRMIKLLIIAMDDKDEWIEYYIYDCSWGSVDNDVRINGEPVPFKTYEDLYDMIKR